ncbi:ParA family protein [Streptomyces albidoflavus]|uniref:ParA family protein n=1 Tax=Streptomyces albidoflavus TaxID=1886 RepID=UPI0033A4A509
MTSSETNSDREKVVTKLPGALRQELKVRAALHGLAMQDAVEAGIRVWQGRTANLPSVDTAGAESYATFLPAGAWGEFRENCKSRGLSLTQGLAQAVTLWLDDNPPPAVKRPDTVRRLVVCNQKGGVGKTAITAGLGEALAEDPTRLVPVRVSKHFAALLDEDSSTADPLALEALPGLGQRVLLVDFDPQGHLTKQLGQEPLVMEGDSLTNHMAGDGKGDLRDLVVAVDEDRFGDRLHLLPACTDAFLLDVRLAAVRAREGALERALTAIEDDYDVILIDCPPSLGLSMDAASYYGRRRPGEAAGNSGVLIVVQAEDSSADAYGLLTSQIEDMRADLALDIDYLGLVVNHYDARRGYIATSSLQSWMDIKDPRVVGVIGDLKEQKEAVRAKRPLLAYSPRCEQSVALRALSREISK